MSERLDRVSLCAFYFEIFPGLPPGGLTLSRLYSNALRSFLQTLTVTLCCCLLTLPTHQMKWRRDQQSPNLSFILCKNKGGYISAP